MMLGKGNTVLSLFVLLCGLVVTISAIDAGKLGITWNANLLTQPEDKPRERYGFSSVVEFNHDVAEFSDDDLVGLAIVAWNDMKKGFNDKPWTEDPYKREAKDAGRRPAVMTVIARGSRLYFASSVRTSRKRAEDPSGSDTLDWVESLDPIVRQGLIDCDVEAGNEDPGDGTGHGNNASCGEPIAMHIALRNGITAQGGLQGARVSFVKHQNDKDSVTKD